MISVIYLFIYYCFGIYKPLFSDGSVSDKIKTKKCLGSFHSLYNSYFGYDAYEKRSHQRAANIVKPDVGRGEGEGGGRDYILDLLDNLWDPTSSYTASAEEDLNLDPLWQLFRQPNELNSNHNCDCNDDANIYIENQNQNQPKENVMPCNEFTSHLFDVDDARQSKAKVLQPSSSSSSSSAFSSLFFRDNNNDEHDDDSKQQQQQQQQQQQLQLTNHHHPSKTTTTTTATTTTATFGSSSIELKNSPDAIKSLLTVLEKAHWWCNNPFSSYTTENAAQVFLY